MNLYLSAAHQLYFYCYRCVLKTTGSTLQINGVNCAHRKLNYSRFSSSRKIIKVAKPAVTNYDARISMLETYVCQKLNFNLL